MTGICEQVRDKDRGSCLREFLRPLGGMGCIVVNKEVFAWIQMVFGDGPGINMDGFVRNAIWLGLVTWDLEQSNVNV